MSRLIDADDLIIEILTHDLIGDDKEVDKIILDAPTVKAIPVEWMRDYVSHWVSEAYKNFVLNMIKNWEKENGRSK